LIGHKKDQGKDDSNSMTNSFQPRETNAGELIFELIDTELMANESLERKDKHKHGNNQV
jgi:hypothetical protein